VALSVAVSIALTVVPVSPILGGGRVGESVGDAISSNHSLQVVWSFSRLFCVRVCVCVCMYECGKSPRELYGIDAWSSLHKELHRLYLLNAYNIVVSFQIKRPLDSPH
jgi:hypothetical protein